MTKPTVFISYSHKDEAMKDRLVTHLGVLQQEGLLDLWDDRRIGAGEDWYPEIEDAMKRASVTILLVSADFLTSKFILNEEVPRLLERQDKEGLRIFPVIIRPCAWNEVKWLAKMQLRPKNGKPLSTKKKHQIETDLTSIAKEVATIIERISLVPTFETSTTTSTITKSTAQVSSTAPININRNEIKITKPENSGINPETYDKLLNWYGKGLELFNTGKYNEAIPCLDKVLEIDQEYILALGYKGDSLSRLGMYGEAMLCFDKALEINPKYVYVLNSKGYVLQLLKKYNDALFYFDKAIEAEPGYIFPWYNKGRVLIDLERFDEAVSSLSKFIELWPESNYSADAKKLIDEITKGNL